jgi:transposase
VVSETLRHALNVLAITAPDWLQTQTPPEWLERYRQRLTEFRQPKAETKHPAPILTQ